MPTSALQVARTGLEAQDARMRVIANNLANMNTTGFKKSKMEFQDMLYQTNRAAGAEAGGGNQVPTSMQVGHGARAAHIADFRTGRRQFLVTTNQSEEGINVGDCNNVLRFDVFHNVKSHVQGSGRAPRTWPTVAGRAVLFRLYR